MEKVVIYVSAIYSHRDHFFLIYCTDIRVNINGIYDLIKIEVYSIIVNLHEGETWGSQEESLFFTVKL
jgi:hypothetical protein